MMTKDLVLTDQTRPAMKGPLLQKQVVTGILGELTPPLDLCLKRTGELDSPEITAHASPTIRVPGGIYSVSLTM